MNTISQQARYLTCGRHRFEFTSLDHIGMTYINCLMIVRHMNIQKVPVLIFDKDDNQIAHFDINGHAYACAYGENSEDERPIWPQG